MPELLFEIGTEEIPAAYMAATLEQVREAIGAKLTEQRIRHGEVKVVGTPRRIVITAQDLAETQEDEEKQMRGPTVKAAFDETGAPTRALEGFLKGQGATVEQIERREVGGGEYVFVNKVIKGRPTAEALQELLPQLVRDLSFPKFMRWGEARIRFVRPIRWFLALFGGEVVPFELEGIKSGRKSRGHRFLAPDEFEVTGSADYFEKLRRAFVVVDQAEREQLIREGVEKTAASVGAAVIEPALLEENVYLVEYPTPLLGRFDDTYLQLPEAVLVTAMKKHEKFFPVRDAQGKLTPYFVSIRNSTAEKIDVVREGNEWVLAARFNDAKFFLDEDLKHNLDHFAGRLGRLVFQEKLGAMDQKVQRIGSIAARLAEQVGFDPETQSQLQTAVRLAKADLSTGMVMELPALQGVVGAEYAKREGVNEYVAEAIEQHYQPKTAGDEIPDNLLARVISLADRMDTLVGYLGLGYMPTGSSDPFALRRAAQGVVEILAAEDEFPNVSALREWAYAAYQTQGVALEEETKIAENLTTLVQIRLNSLLEQEGVRYDLTRAALGGGWNDSVSRLVLRAQTLQSLADDAHWEEFVTAAIRPANIVNSARKNNQPMGERLADVQDSLMKTEQEIALFETAANLSSDITKFDRMGDYERVYETLFGLAAPINAFFDKVMVMDEDPEQRRNRLTLMAGLSHLFLALGDFTQVVVEGR